MATKKKSKAADAAPKKKTSAKSEAAAPAPKGDKLQHISADGLELMETWEEMALIQYEDGYGYQTIGYGHRIAKGENFDGGISKEQAEEIFAADIQVAETAVRDAIQQDVQQNQFDALVSLAFNIGGANFAGSEVVRHVNKRHFASAAQGFLQWVTAGGEKSRGLVRRRAQEVLLFTEEADDRFAA